MSDPGLPGILSHAATGADARAAADLGAADRAAERPMQAALTFASAEADQVRLDDPSLRKRHHKGLRGDARRTAEYVSARGRTPVEQLHDVARMDRRKAIKIISAEAQCSRLEALRFWKSCQDTLAPYVHSAMPRLDLDNPAVAGVIGLAAAHYLAASAASAAARAAVSGNTEFSDRALRAPDQAVMDLEPMGNVADVATELPPRGRD